MKSFADNLTEAEYFFFEEVIQAAKSRFPHLGFRVRRSGDTVWLEYDGEDRGDMPMMGYVALTSKNSSSVLILVHNTSPMTGTTHRDIRSESGLLTTKFVCDILEGYYGS
jgi:hypothetical protein